MVNRTYGKTKKVSTIGTKVTTTNRDFCSTTRRPKPVKKTLLINISDLTKKINFLPVYLLFLQVAKKELQFAPVWSKLVRLA